MHTILRKKNILTRPIKNKKSWKYNCNTNSLEDQILRNHIDNKLNFMNHINNLKQKYQSDLNSLKQFKNGLGDSL